MLIPDPDDLFRSVPNNSGAENSFIKLDKDDVLIAVGLLLIAGFITCQIIRSKFNSLDRELEFLKTRLPLVVKDQPGGGQAR